MKSKVKWLAAAALVALAGAAQAALIDRGGGMIYDTTRNITWLADMNYAATELTDTRLDAIKTAVGSVAGHALVDEDFEKAGSTYAGRMTWWGAMAWADDLVYGATATGACLR